MIQEDRLYSLNNIIFGSMQIHIPSYDVGRHSQRDARRKSITCKNNNNGFHLSSTFPIKILPQTWAYWILPWPYEEGNLKL